MATFVQATTGFNSSGSNTNLFTNNFGSACTAGNALIIAVFMDSATATISGITDTATVHNTYTQLATFASGFGTIWLYQALNITDNSGTVYQVQVTEGTALDGQITVQEWSGFATSGNILDVSRTDSGTSANPTTSGTLTTNQSNEVIFSLLMLQASSNTYSAGSGYSNVSSLASSFTSAGMESAALAAASGTTAGFGMTNTGTSYIQLTAGLLTTASTPLGAVLSPHPLLMKLSLADSRQHVPIIRGFASQVTYTPQLYIQDLSAGVSFSGSFGPTQTNKSLSANLSFTGNLTRAIARTLVATLSFTGSLTKQLARTLTTGILSFTGSLGKQTSRTLTASVALNNLVSNPDFENAPPFVAATTTNQRWIEGTPAGSTTNNNYRWAIITEGGSNATFFDSSQSNSGSFSMKVSTTAVASFIAVRPMNATSVANLSQYGISAQPSTSYTVRYAMKTNLVSGSATSGANMTILEYAAGSTTVLATTNVNTAVTTTTGWTVYTKTFTTQSTTAIMVPSLNVTGSNGAATLIMDAWFDDVSIVPTFGILTKQTNRFLAATLSFTGKTTKGLARAFTASLSFVGSLVTSRPFTQTFTASLSFTGTFGPRNITKRLLGYLSFVIPPDQTGGGLGSGYFGGIYYGEGYTGPLPSAFTKTILYPVLATVSFTGNTAKGMLRSLAGILNFNQGTSSAISRISSQDANGNSATTSVSATYPGATTSGNLLIALCGAITGGTVNNCTISGWTRLLNNTWGAGSYELALFYKLADGTETTVTANAPGAAIMQLQIYEYIGNANPIVTDGTNTSNTASNVTSLATGAITTTNANDLIFTGGLSNSSSSTFSWSTATLLQAQANLAAGEHIVSTLQSGYTDTFQSTHIGPMGTVIGAFKAATSTTTSSFTKRTNKPLAAALSFVGSLASTLNPGSHSYTQIFTASLGFTGAIMKATTYPIGGALSFTGSIARTTKAVMTAALSFTGSILKKTQVIFSAGVSFAGSIRRSVVAVLSAVLSFTGNFVTAKSGLFTVALTASVGFTGAIAKSSRRSLAAILTVNFGAAIPVARHIQSTFSSGSGSLATLNISAASTSNFLVIGLRLFASGGPKTITVTDNASIPNTYALAGSELLNDTNNNSVYQLYGVQITGGATQIMLSWTGSFTYVALADEFSGTAASNAAVFDATSMTNSNNVAQTSSAVPAFSPASDGELIVANIAANGAVGTPVAGNGYTLGAIDSTGIKAFQQYKLSSSGAETAPASWDLNTTWGEIATAYKLRQPTLFPLVKSTGKALNGGLSFVGAIAKSTSHAVFFIATLGFTGSIGRTTRRSLTATVSPAGAGAKQVRLPLAAAVSMTSSIGKRTGRVLSAAVSFSGSIGRVMSRSFRASVGLIGSLLSLIRSPFLPTNTINLSQNDNTVDLSQSDTETVTLSQEDESNDVFL